MNKKQFILGLLLASVFGGLVALGTYSLLGGKEEYDSIEQRQNSYFAKYVTDTSKIVVPEGLNFIYVINFNIDFSNEFSYSLPNILSSLHQICGLLFLRHFVYIHIDKNFINLVLVSISTQYIVYAVLVNILCSAD